MVSNCQEKTIAPTDVARMKFKHQIALAKQNKISWEDLAIILDVLTPTFMSLKQLITTLLEELKTSINNQNTKPTDSVDVEDEVIIVESEDAQDAQEMDEIESVTNDEKMPTLKDVQLSTQSESSNKENDTANEETLTIENELESDISKDDDQDTDEKVAKLSKEEMDALNVDAKVEMHSRPKITYIQLIAEALLNAKEKGLRLSEIYNAIVKRYPFYNLKDKGWQNSIRHKLSLHKGRYFNLLAKSGIWKLLPEGEEYCKSGGRRGKKRENRIGKPSIPEIVGDAVIKAKSKDAQEIDKMDEIESVTISTDELNTEKVQISTENRSLNQENIVNNSENITYENELESRILEDGDQVMDKVETITKGGPNTENTSKVHDSTENEASTEEGAHDKIDSIEDEIEVTIQNESIKTGNEQGPEIKIDLKCEICDKIFSHKNNLKFHYRFIHELSSKEANEKVRFKQNTKLPM